MLDWQESAEGAAVAVDIRGKNALDRGGLCRFAEIMNVPCVCGIVCHRCHDADGRGSHSEGVIDIIFSCKSWTQKEWGL